MGAHRLGAQAIHKLMVYPREQFFQPPQHTFAQGSRVPWSSSRMANWKMKSESPGRKCGRPAAPINVRYHMIFTPGLIVLGYMREYAWMYSLDFFGRFRILITLLWLEMMHAFHWENGSAGVLNTARLPNLLLVLSWPWRALFLPWSAPGASPSCIRSEWWSMRVGKTLRSLGSPSNLINIIKFQIE